MADFLSSRLRRAVILSDLRRDSLETGLPFCSLHITELAIEHGVEMMDYLIGPYTGRIMPPLATLDLVGLDITRPSFTAMQDHTSDPLHERIVLPNYINEMIASGRLGRKAATRGIL